MNTITLTTLETKVLASLFDSADSNGHDFGLVEDARGIVEPAQLGAIVASLVKKNILRVEGQVVTDQVWTQFTWKMEVDEVSRLLGR